MTDSEDDPTPPFSTAIYMFESAQQDFERALEEAGLEDGKDYRGIRWDTYDNSIELDHVRDDVRLTEAQQRIIFDAGFSRAFVNHQDGWETHYHWDKEFAVCRGWRRRWVVDPAATTTNVVGGARRPEDHGYFEISYWPEGWTHKEWLDTGYMRVVPDPLSP